MSVECYRLNDRGKWELTPYSNDEDTSQEAELEVHFTSVGLRCPISLLYEDVEFSPNNEH